MFLQNLKEKTAQQHRLLEECPLSQNLMSKAVTLRDYSAYLSRMYGFVYGFEKFVFPLLTNHLADIGRRQKITLLEADLHKLGIEVSALPVIPPVFFSSTYTSESLALGGMYVLEGSVLGGAVIIKHVESILDDPIGDKSSYLKAYGANTGMYWSSFREQLCANAPGKEEGIITGAALTFAALYHWFSNTTFKIAIHEHSKSC